MPSRAGFAFPPAPTVRASGPLLIQLFMAGQGIHSYAKYATSLLRLSGYRGRCLLVSMFLVEKCYVTNAVKHFKREPRGKGGSIKNRTAGRSPRAALGGRPNLRSSSHGVSCVSTARRRGLSSSARSKSCGNAAVSSRQLGRSER